MLLISRGSAALFLVTYLFCVQGECPPTWVQYGGSCYNLGKHLEKWIEAEQICKIYGSYLAEVTTPEENHFVTGYVKSTDWRETTIVWFGLNHVFTRRDWIWAMSFQNATFSDWAPGEPSNYDENCAGFESDMQWHDFVCDSPNYFLCERR